jgi:hypothetical protein
MFKHVVRKKSKRLQLMDEDALLGDGASAIRVTIKK